MSAARSKSLKNLANVEKVKSKPKIDNESTKVTPATRKVLPRSNVTQKKASKEFETVYQASYCRLKRTKSTTVSRTNCGSQRIMVKN